LRIRAVILDLDGTLADTAGEIAIALNRTLAEEGRAPLELPEVAALVGRGVRTLIERADAKTGGGLAVDAAILRFEVHYAQTIATEAALYPGTAQGLQRLREAGVPLAMATNKPRVFTQLLLERFALAETFAAVVCGDDGIVRKPAGDMLLAACAAMKTAPAASLMLGDSGNDVRAARAAGCPVWCVPYGYTEGREVAELGADRIVASIDVAAGLLLT
jgi:phosphoglycolate phosphatase